MLAAVSYSLSTAGVAANETLNFFISVVGKVMILSSAMSESKRLRRLPAPSAAITDLSSVEY